LAVVSLQSMEVFNNLDMFQYELRKGWRYCLSLAFSLISCTLHYLFVVFWAWTRLWSVTALVLSQVASKQWAKSAERRRASLGDDKEIRHVIFAGDMLSSHRSRQIKVSERTDTLDPFVLREWPWFRWHPSSCCNSLNEIWIGLSFRESVQLS
jgi:hypothetical protein